MLIAYGATALQPLGILRKPLRINNNPALVGFSQKGLPGMGVSKFYTSAAGVSRLTIQAVETAHSPFAGTFLAYERLSMQRNHDGWGGCRQSEGYGMPVKFMKKSLFAIILGMSLFAAQPGHAAMFDFVDLANNVLGEGPFSSYTTGGITVTATAMATPI